MTPAAALAVLVLAEAGQPAEPAEAGEPVVHDATAVPAAAGARSFATAPPNVVVPGLHSLALMAGMRVAEAVIWPNPFARTQWFGDYYKEAFTKPPVFDPRKPAFQWDGDSVFVNVVGHGLFGSELYLRARQCRWGVGGSLAFAAGSSAVWEFAIEASGSRPSAEDLVYTPLAGAVFGELRFLAHRAAGRLDGPLRTVIRVAVDPFGELERAAGTDC